MKYTSKEVYEFISRQASDPIVQWKTCTVSGTEFPIYQSDLNFYDKISPTFAGQKFQIPMPTLCPEERQRRRLSFRNERKLYRRKCDATGENIISIYSPDKPYKVYDQKVWWSDVRDPMSYGFEFDFSTTFRENFEKLHLQVPKMSLINEVDSLENSDYVNNSMTSKNCYMLSGGTDSEYCMYSTTAYYDQWCVDCYKLYHSNYCYESLYSYQCHGCYHIISCKGCSDSSYLMNCQNCSDCYGCTGLINKKYCYNNIQYSKAQYDSIPKVGQYYTANIILANNSNINCNSSFGNLIINSNQIGISYDITDSQNCKYSIGLMNCQDSYDLSLWGDGLSLSYECKEVGVGSSSVLFSYTCFNGIHNTLYSQFCVNSSHCFGCISLRNKQYCIFNKQYTKEEYEIIVAKIIQHMMATGERGEFFHPSLSPFGYNETVAQEYFPIKEGELSDFGYKWNNYSSDPVIPAGVQTIERKNYNDEQREMLKDNDEILKQILICEVSGRPYRIVKQELEFYRKHNLPIPSKHPDIRHEERMKLRPGRILYLRKCDCCEKEMLSVYSDEHNGRVYCEECYQKEVFG